MIHTEAWYKQAFGEQDYERALREALRSGPEDSEVWLNLWMIATRLGKVNDIPFYVWSDAIAYLPDSRAYEEMYESYLKRAAHEGVSKSEYLDVAMEIDPQRLYEYIRDNESELPPRYPWLGWLWKVSEMMGIVPDVSKKWVDPLNTHYPRGLDAQIARSIPYVTFYIRNLAQDSAVNRALGITEHYLDIDFTPLLEGEPEIQRLRLDQFLDYLASHGFDHEGLGILAAPIRRSHYLVVTGPPGLNIKLKEWYPY